MNRWERMLAELALENREVEREWALVNEVARARAFLAGLDPTSVEGLWFDALASAFPSREHAAVAYLRDVRPRG